MTTAICFARIDNFEHTISGLRAKRSEMREDDDA
jgi:hypothetical protein